MIRELEVLVRDRQMRPRVGLRVGLYMSIARVQSATTGADGVACFVVPDIATATIVVDGVADEHPVRMQREPVRRIAVPQ
jgi:hypothetical protein